MTSVPNTTGHNSNNSYNGRSLAIQNLFSNDSEQSSSTPESRKQYFKIRDRMANINVVDQNEDSELQKLMDIQFKECPDLYVIENMQNYTNFKKTFLSKYENIERNIKNYKLILSIQQSPKLGEVFSRR